MKRRDVNPERPTHQDQRLLSFGNAADGVGEAIDDLRVRILPNQRQEERINGLLSDLKAGRRVNDFRFDELFPPLIRKLSGIHWTPVAVAVRAAELLAAGVESHILDIGSGCGKFCFIGALTTGSRFTGVEQREYLVETARRIAGRWEITNASFIHSNMINLDWNSFNGFYLFNPFYENITREIRLDDDVSLNEEKYRGYIKFVEEKLEDLAYGTRVVTYHGFGGQMPKGYECVLREPAGTSQVELWIKMANGNCLVSPGTKKG